MKNLAKNQKNLLLFGAVFAVSLFVATAISGGKAFAYHSNGVGDGSSGSPFHVVDCTNLSNINTQEDAYYVLDNDLDCSDTPITNTNGLIGSLDDTSGFTGSFNGQGHIITVRIDLPSQDGVGLFARISSAGVVKNLTVFGTAHGHSAVGIITGDMRDEARLENVSSYGNVTCNSQCGGLTGTLYDTSRIDLSYSTATIHGGNYTGGLVGDAEGTADPDPVNIINSYYNGDIISTGENVGGILGRGDAIYIQYVYSAGTIVGADILGGLAGDIGGGHINNSWSAIIMDKSQAVSTDALIDGFSFNPADVAAHVSHNYFLAEVTGFFSSAFGTSFANHPSFYFSDQPMFTGWTFDSTHWRENFNTYPTLKPLFDPVMYCEEPGSTDTTIHGKCDIIPLGWGETAWEVRWSVHGEDSWHIVDLDDVRFPETTVTGLTPGTLYDLQFRYTNDSGTGEWGTNEILTTGTAPDTGGKGGDTKTTTKKTKVVQTSGSTYSAPADDEIATSKDEAITDDVVVPAAALQDNSGSMTDNFGFDDSAKKHMDGFSLFGKGLILFGVIIVILSVLGMVYKDSPKSG